MNDNIRRIFSLDLRSLALFRIYIGSFLIIDLGLRSQDIVAHYTDEGIMPRYLYPEQLFSFHSLGGSVYYEAGLFIIAGLFAFSLLIGYKTKISLFISWILFVSLQNRNLDIMHGGDSILCFLLFWSLFLPLGEVLSVDSVLKRYTPKIKNVYTTASIIYVLQIFVIYFFNFLNKISSPEWLDGSAVYYALHSTTYTNPIGRLLLSYPFMLPTSTYLTLFTEGLMPFLLFIPFLTFRLRILFIIWMFFLHIGFGLGLRIGTFTFVSFGMLLPLVPCEFWEYLRLYPIFNTLKIKLPKLSSDKNSLISVHNSLFVSIIIFVFLYQLFINIMFFYNVPNPLPKSIMLIGSVMQFNARWRFFALPLRKEAWIIVAGRTDNNQEINLLRQGEKLSFTKPPLGMFYYPSARWGPYFIKLSVSRDSKKVENLALFYCKNWNESHLNETIHQVEIYSILETTLSPHFQAYDRTNTQLLTQKSCTSFT